MICLVLLAHKCEYADSAMVSGPIFFFPSLAWISVGMSEAK